MNIIIGADIVPTKTNDDLFEVGNAEALMENELTHFLNTSDYRIFNLETPLTDTEAPISKNGPNLIASAKSVNGYKAIGVNLLTVANNHIMDQGEQGFFSTLKLLKKNGIDYVGAGENVRTAREPYVFEIDNIKIGVYACAEHEFSIATENMAGANPFEPLDSFDHICELKQKCDRVIVLYHGGKEHYRYPSPYLQKICRKFIEKGADIIVCQHSHCVGCEEKYLQGTIVYGQGNFIFDAQDNEFWKTSLLISVNEEFNIKYIPLIKKGNGVRFAKKNEANNILEGFKKRSEQIKQAGFLEKKYAEFAKENIYNYLLNISGIRYSFFMRVLNKISRGKFIVFFIKRKYKQNKVLKIINYMDCESHRELFLKGLESM